MRRIFTFFVAFFPVVAHAEIETVLKVYSVKPGDTFYKISQNFYGTPSRWREIWEYNKYIKDPHWIFPGDDIIVPTYREKKEVPPEEKKPGEAVAEEKEEQFSDTFIAPYYKGLKNPIGFQPDGEIADFVDKTVLLQAQHSKVIINIGKEDGVKPKDVYKIFRVDRKIEDPKTGRIVGVLIKKIGACEVSESISDISSIATILYSDGLVEKGDMLKK